MLGECVEVESGKRNDRPELAKALAACKKHRAKLVIAKLDRLARNVAFIANLMDGKVEFVCCDMTACRHRCPLFACVSSRCSRARSWSCLIASASAEKMAGSVIADAPNRTTGSPERFPAHRVNPCNAPRGLTSSDSSPGSDFVPSFSPLTIVGGRRG